MSADHSTLAASREWLEADGLGGFASGTATGIRTRRYHALLLYDVIDHLEHSGLGHVSEIADAEAPHAPRGCPWQAWSVGEALWLDRVVLAQPPPRSTRNVRRNQRSPKLAEKPRRSMPSRDLVSA